MKQQSTQVLNGLFPVELGDDEGAGRVAKIVQIAIRRNNGRGAWESIPRRYLAEELENEEQLFALCGPGLYELVGVDSQGRIVRRQRHELAGEVAEEEPSEPQGSQSAPVASHPPEGAEGMSATERMMMLMISQSRADADRTLNMFLQMQTNQMQQTTAMITALAAGRGDGGSITATLLEKLLDHREQGDPQAVFLKGVETAADLTAGKREAEAEAKGGSELTDFIEVAKQAMGLYQAAKGLTVDPAAEAEALRGLGVTNV